MMGASGAWYFPGSLVGPVVEDVPNRRVTYSSEEHHRLFGFDPAAEMPGLDDWVRRIHPDDRETVKQTMQRTIRDRRDYELEHRVVHPDGTIKFIHTSATLFSALRVISSRSWVHPPTSRIASGRNT